MIERSEGPPGVHRQPEHCRESLASGERHDCGARDLANFLI
jgi:hypothetical protein